MVCLPLAGLNHGAASDRWPTWGQASLPRSGFVQVPSLGCVDKRDSQPGEVLIQTFLLEGQAWIAAT